MGTKPLTSEEANSMVEGKLGMELERYPLKFATAAYFGARTEAGTPATVNSGSASLLRLSGHTFALTCSHVLEGYRQRLAEDGKVIFQLGNCELDPLAQLKAEDKKLDFALLGLTEDQARELVSHEGPFDGTFFVEPSQWPPAAVAVGEFVAFGGFPGELRKVNSFDEISFGSYSCGGAEVTAVGDDYLVCQFDRDRWVKHGHEPEPSTIRGLSGGPVFAIRHGYAGIITHEFIGHVYEFSETWELLYVRLSRAIKI